MWIVWDKEDGLICTGDYEFCIEEYEKHKKVVEDYLINEDELSEEEIGTQVIFAKVDRLFELCRNPEGTVSFKELDGTDLEEGTE